MSNLKKLAGQTMVYGLSSVVARLLNFLLVPYLTRILGKEQYGVITDFYALIPFALIVLTMGMESGYFKFAGKAQNNAEKNKIFATTWGAVSVAAMLFMAVVMLFKPQISSVMGYSDHQSWIWIVGAIVALDAIKAVPFARLREQGKAGKYVLINVISVIIQVVFNVFFYTVLPWMASKGVMTAIYNPDFGPGYVLVSNLISSVVVFLIILPFCDRVVPRIDKKIFRTIFLYSLPLLISGIAGTANEFIDRQMIKYILPAGESEAALGVFGAVTKLAVIMTLFMQMYRLGAEPYFLADFKKNDDFKRANAEAMKYYVLVSVLIFLVVALLKDAFGLILGKDFREGTFILPVVLVSNMLSGIVLNLSFWYKQTGETKFAIYIMCTGLVFTIIFNIMLVPKLGYFGAALARLVCELVMVALSYYLNKKHYPIPYDLKRIGEYLLVGGVLYALGAIGGKFTGVFGEYALSISIIGIFAIYAVRRERIDVKGILKSVVKRR